MFLGSKYYGIMDGRGLPQVAAILAKGVPEKRLFHSVKAVKRGAFETLDGAQEF